MGTVVFISYRKEDSLSAASQIARLLKAELGEDAIFIDEQSIPPGARWPDEVRSALAAADVVLVVIGPDWLATGSASSDVRRIDEENDWVRQEVAIALQSSKTVIPVLVKGAALPSPGELPVEIASLTDWQSIELRPDWIDVDIKQLIVRIPARRASDKGLAISTLYGIITTFNVNTGESYRSLPVMLTNRSEARTFDDVVVELKLPTGIAFQKSSDKQPSFGQVKLQIGTVHSGEERTLGSIRKKYDCHNPLAGSISMTQNDDELEWQLRSRNTPPFSGKLDVSWLRE